MKSWTLIDLEALNEFILKAPEVLSWTDMLWYFSKADLDFDEVQDYLIEGGCRIS